LPYLRHPLLIRFYLRFKYSLLLLLLSASSASYAVNASAFDSLSAFDLTSAFAVLRVFRFSSASFSDSNASAFRFYFPL